MTSMDAESVRSGRSERSNHSNRAHRAHQSQASDGRHSQASEGRQSRDGRHRSDRHSSRHSRGPASERGPETDDDRASTAVNMRGSGDELEERVEVQILPQDDNWGETTTAITDTTSATAFSMEDVRIGKDLEQSIGFNCARYMGTFIAGGLSFISFLSPVAMVVLPKIGIKEVHKDPCGPECEGFFISFAFKLLILLIGTWALFFRKPRATMARIFIFRALVLFLLFVLTFAFWLFYWVRIWNVDFPKYYSILLFAGQMVDGLLFIHYLSIILLEIRQLQPQYAVKITRSPDGEARTYTVGQFSIQRLAVWCLEQYYKDFEVYNPYLEHIPRKLPKMSGFKFYDVDGVTQPVGGSARNSRAVFAAAARRRDSSHNDRFYEEQEYERRVRKRRARLIVAAEEAFTHIKRLQEEQGPAIPMEPHQAAQTIFASMARAMQKYLRITRQQPRYTMEGIIDHLATCISHDLSPKAFLERYMTQGPVIWNDKIHNITQTWVLVCSQLLSRAVQDNTVFQLRQGDVSLLITVRRLPHFNLTEDVIDAKNNKFVLRLNSETSV